MKIFASRKPSNTRTLEQHTAQMSTIPLARDPNHNLLDTRLQPPYTSPMTQERLAKEHMPDEARLKELLFGRKIVLAERIAGSSDTNYAEGRLVLDDGTVLLVGGNDGCGGCPSGNYWLETPNTVDNAITNVVLEETFDGTYEEDGSYKIFVIAEDHNQHLIAQFDGSDGNGYYGTGWWLTVASPSLGGI